MSPDHSEIERLVERLGVYAEDPYRTNHGVVREDIIAARTALLNAIREREPVGTFHVGDGLVSWHGGTRPYLNDGTYAVVPMSNNQ